MSHDACVHSGEFLEGSSMIGNLRRIVEGWSSHHRHAPHSGGIIESVLPIGG